MKKIITDINKLTLELQSVKGVLNYQSKLSELTRSDLCTELSNVMAAKHNLMMFPSGLDEYFEKQKIVTDLTDKATAICFFEFGQSVVLDYASGDLRPFNELVNNINEEVARQKMNPEQHGSMLLYRLSERLEKSIRSITLTQFEEFNPVKTEMARAIYNECLWFQDKVGNIIGTVVLDTIDNNFSYIIQGRDQNGLFHCIKADTDFDTRDEAEQSIINTMESIADSKKSVFPQ